MRRADGAVLLSPDPQLHADWLDKEVEAAQRRNQQPRQKHAPSDPGSSSNMMRGMLPREIIQQLKAAQFSSTSVGGLATASAAASLQNSAANSTCTTVNSSAVNSRHQSRRPSFSEFTQSASGSGSSSHDRHSSNSKSLSAEQDELMSSV